MYKNQLNHKKVVEDSVLKVLSSDRFISNEMINNNTSVRLLYFLTHSVESIMETNPNEMTNPSRHFSCQCPRR